jgi:hypothetical protein
MASSLVEGRPGGKPVLTDPEQQKAIPGVVAHPANYTAGSRARERKNKMMWMKQAYVSSAHGLPRRKIGPSPSLGVLSL